VNPENTFTIRGATILDGTGTPGVRNDLLVINGKIAINGKILKGEEQGKIFDGSDLTITPGFIDMHAHSDLAVLADKEHLAKVTQGVTLEVVGQDGLSYVPSDENTQALLRQQLYGWNGDPAGFKWNFHSVAQYLDRVDEGAAVNVAYLIPHGAVRMLVKGNDEGYADSNELAQMSAIVETGMEEGAIGLSAGLTYTPAMYASDDELVNLCQVVAKFGGYYAPHHRNYGSQFLEAVDACIEISRASGSALHLTHCHMSAPVYHDKTELLFERIEKAERAGIDITLDTYPYLAGSTYLHALLPSWAQAGGVDQMAQRLKSAEVRSRVIDALNKTGSDGNQGGVVNWKIIVVAGVEASLDLVGLSIEEAANRNQMEPASFYLDLIAKENYRASCVIFSGHEGNVRSIMQHPKHMVGSDGILTGNRPHPRSYGTFARYLGHYAREEKVLTFEGAVNRMTGRPASRLGLTDRGIIKEGMHADLVMLDAASVIDRSTYENPRLPAAGFEYVWIGGVTTLAQGVRTSNLPGRAIRSTS
jgi:N-acyl-D-amino-acid deacylase